LPASRRAGTLRPLTPPSPAPHRTPIPPLPGIGWGLILPLLLPAAGLLLVAGLGGLAALRRKRKALAPLAVA